MAGLYILPLLWTNICLVRRQAMGVSNLVSVPPTLIESAMEGQRPVLQSLQVDTQLSEGRPADQGELSPRGMPRGTRRPHERMLFASQTRYSSPEARFVCNGWCEISEDPHPNVVSTGCPLL